MSEQNQPFDTLQDVKDIRRLMERSSRFTTLSGLSCVAAGVAALGGAWVAYDIIASYYGQDISQWQFNGPSFAQLERKLLLTAVAVFAVAFTLAFYFTWQKSKKQGVALWDHSSKKVFWSMAVPLVAGAVFILGMLRYDEWRFAAPGCLVFYGLALVSAGKYTVADIRYLGYCEIILGSINLFYIGYGFYFWVAGFGILHIVYGISMWWKYERKNVNA